MLVTYVYDDDDVYIGNRDRSCIVKTELIELRTIFRDHRRLSLAVALIIRLML